MKNSPYNVLIVGAGLAGLSCAQHLFAKGISFLLLEGSDAVGGRVRTDEVNGFLLDRGFQVLQTAYPEAQQTLDYSRLDLHRFAAGALVRFRGRFHRVMDPWRNPQKLLHAIFSPIGTFADKLRVAHLKYQVCYGSIEALFHKRETSTIMALRNYGFSNAMIDRFFRPFFSGVFFENELETSSRMFEFVFRMFAKGDVALPKHGMRMIPEQIAAPLPWQSISLNTRVEAVTEDKVLLASGEEIKADYVVLATDGTETARLLSDSRSFETCPTTCLYFSSTTPPINEPILVLDGDGTGPVTNLCVPSVVSNSYAPAGKSLISATVLGHPKESDQGLEAMVRVQLTGWFGAMVEQWEHLKTYHILHALPRQTPPLFDPFNQPYRARKKLLVCGEFHSVSSIQWAMYSGRKTAELIASELHA